MEKMIKPPHFVIIGFPRCGTTAIHQALNRHPQICCFPNEGWFYDPNKSVRPMSSQSLKIFMSKKIIGDRGPCYIRHKDIIKDIYQKKPDTKLIICLRHPIQALHSFYNLRCYEYYWGETENINPGTISFSDLALNDLDIAHTSNSVYFYNHYIRENVLPFFDMKQIYFVIQEKMFKNAENEMRKIYSFLGVAPCKTPSTKNYSFNMYGRYKYVDYNSRNYVKAIEKLYRLYKTHNEQLFRLIGTDIPEWKEFDRHYHNIFSKENPIELEIIGPETGVAFILFRYLELNFNVKCKIDPRKPDSCQYKLSKFVYRHKNKRNKDLFVFIKNEKIDPMNSRIKEAPIICHEDLMANPIKIIDKFQKVLNIDKINDTHIVANWLTPDLFKDRSRFSVRLKEGIREKFNILKNNIKGMHYR